MNELRLQYQKDTGIQIDPIIKTDDIAAAIFTSGDEDEYDCTCEVGLELTNWAEVKKYIEWLEKEIEDATKQVQEINDIVNNLRFRMPSTAEAAKSISNAMKKITTKSDRNT